MDHEALTYVRAFLTAHETESLRPGQAFRTRFSHIQRVCMWVERLLAQGGVDDARALRLAAAFHDVGYVRGEDGHGIHSAVYLRAYAGERGIPEAVARRAAFLVAEHSSKHQWMTDPAAPRDLILLMEADLLDEEGAMGLALDCMTAGAMGAASYMDAYTRMQRFEPSRLAQNPMVTPLARSYWKGKQQIIRAFMTAFAFDLGLENET